MLKKFVLDLGHPQISEIKGSVIYKNGKDYFHFSDDNPAYITSRFYELGGKDKEIELKLCFDSFEAAKLFLYEQRLKEIEDASMKLRHAEVELIHAKEALQKARSMFYG